jgi:hypothetical protein
MNRTKTWLLAVGLLSVLSCPAWAQGTSFQGYSQEDVYFPRPEMTDDWFSQPDLSTYGRGPRPPEGPYFTMDYLRMSIQQPSPTSIGDPGSSLSTVEYDSKWQDGSRFELGNRVGKYGNRGWMVGGYTMSQDQDIEAGGASVVFTGVAAIPVYDFLDARNEVKSYGLEVNRSWRPIPGDRPFSPVCEYFLGLRYAYFADDYNVQGDRDGAGGFDDFWNTKSENSLFGPQVGMRISKQNGPWTFAFDGRAFAAYNWRSISQQYNLDQATISTIAPGLTTGNLGGNAEIDSDDFAPMGEIRFDISYLLTRRVKARFGYTGYYFTNLARAPSMVTYLPPTALSNAFGIDMTQDSQNVWAQGIHMGIEINH